MPKKIEIYRVYKAKRHQRYYYFILDENKELEIYLSDKTNLIFSSGYKEKGSSFIYQFIQDFGLLTLCSIEEESKIRLLTNIFLSEEDDNNKN